MANSTSFDTNARKAIQIAHRRKWTLIGFILFTIILIIVFFVVHQIKSSKELLIANEFAEIDNIYNQENMVYQEKLQEQKSNTSSQPIPKLEPDYSTSMSRFYEFALKYPHNPNAWQAAIRSSTYFISKNNLEFAQKELEAILPFTSQHELIQIKIRTTLAGIYATQNNSQKALEQFKIVENLPHNPNPNQSRLLKAQFLISLGQIAEAKKVLNQIISTPDPATPMGSQDNEFVQKAKVYLNKIGL